MYMFVRLFKNTTTAFFTLLMLNLFIGIALSLIVFLLNFYQYKPEVSEAYKLFQVDISITTLPRDQGDWTHGI